MKYRPMIFQGWGIRAMMGGQKTQTRRLITRHNSTVDAESVSEEFWDALDFSKAWVDAGFGDTKYLKVPYPPEGTVHRVRCKWQKGDRFWVKETYCDTSPVFFGYLVSDKKCIDGPCYRATDEGDCTVIGQKWKSSMFMPRWASRLTIELLEDPEPQRVQDISEEDARAEGGKPLYDIWDIEFATGNKHPPNPTFKKGFETIWDSINGKKPGCSWEDNPWVWPVKFKRVEENK